MNMSNQTGDGNRMFCAHCGYDLTSIPGGEVVFCPSCGTKVVSEDKFSGGDGGAPVIHQPTGRSAGYHSQAIPMQPIIGGQQQMQWMQRPEITTGVPQGFEYLTQLDQLLIKQQLELLEIVTRMQTQNKYVVNNTLGQQVYFVAEESTDVSRQCCPYGRSFILHCLDNFNQEVMRMTREYVSCPCPTFACCKDTTFEIVVEAPVGNVIGYITQGFSLCLFIRPNFKISDYQRNDLAVINGPDCLCQGQGGQNFQIFTPDESRELGQISKQWTNYAQEMYTKANNFSVTFSANENVTMKALLFAATFMVDYTLFE